MLKDLSIVNFQRNCQLSRCQKSGRTGSLWQAGQNAELWSWSRHRVQPSIRLWWIFLHVLEASVLPIIWVDVEILTKSFPRAQGVFYFIHHPGTRRLSKQHKSLLSRLQPRTVARSVFSCREKRHYLFALLIYHQRHNQTEREKKHSVNHWTELNQCVNVVKAGFHLFPGVYLGEHKRWRRSSDNGCFPRLILRLSGCLSSNQGLSWVEKINTIVNMI